MKYIPIAFLIICFSFTISAQNNSMEIPYAQIPDYPESYTPETVTARMIDGLGYRFYWATKELRPEDISYKPEGENTKTVDETLDHILSLSKAIRNTCFGLPNVRPVEVVDFPFFQKRKMILQNLLEASEHLKSTDKLLETNSLVFQRGEQSSEFPFWHLLNGQLSDAIYHTGQLVSYRRSSGNPLDPMVNVFMGKNRKPK